jgi:hypothetical protein
MNIKHISIQVLICTVLLGTAVPSFARTDGGGKKGAQKYPNQPPNHQNSRGNCYYCWKDLSIDYTPSRHKYARKS